MKKGQKDILQKNLYIWFVNSGAFPEEKERSYFKHS